MLRVLASPAEIAADPRIRPPARAAENYASSMCSKRERPVQAADLGTQLTAAIDEFAARVSAAHDADSPELAARLAGAWAAVTAADPELAARTAVYSH